MTTEELNFSSICRICCSEGQMMSLFKVHIHKKLMACASIQVWPNDGLPTQICSKCIAKLHIAFQFKRLCEKSDSRLRNHLSYVKNINQKNECVPQILVASNSNQPLATAQFTNAGEFLYVANNTQADSVAKAFDGNHSITESYSIPLQSYSLHNVPTVQLQTYNLQLPASNPILTLNGEEIQSIYTSSSQPTAMHSPRTITCRSRIASNVCKLVKLPHSDVACSICGKRFNSSIKLNRHMKTHSNESPYKCKICHKGFSHSGNFKVHMRMHNDERPYQCSMCNRACRQQQDLEKHMRTHTGERPHICQVCSKAFSTSSNLIAHTRTHSGEKPYVCSICQKAFCQSNELTKHLRSHTGEKTHICKLCNKGFNGSSTLVVHMRSHTGERPYTCYLCNKAFTQSSCLQVHLKRHYSRKGNGEITCEQCNKRFHRPIDLNKHLENHSGEVEISL